MSLVLYLIFLFHFMNSWVSTTDVIQGSCTLGRAHIFPYWYLVVALPWPCLPSIVDALFSTWLSPLMMLSTLICLFPVWFYPHLHFLAYLSLCCSVFHQYCWVFLGGGTFADHFLCCVCFPLQVLVEFLCLSSFMAFIAFVIFEKCTCHFICHSMFEFRGWGKVLLLDSPFMFLHCDFSCLLVWIFLLVLFKGLLSQQPVFEVSISLMPCIENKNKLPYVRNIKPHRVRQCLKLIIKTN